MDGPGGENNKLTLGSPARANAKVEFVFSLRARQVAHRLKDVAIAVVPTLAQARS